MSVQIRPFRRTDRDQLTELANAHVSAVVPGVTISTNRLLGQLEREPGEFIVDPWVEARHTLVAEQRGRVSAAAHLLIYRDHAEVGPTYRGLGEIRWLLCWPNAPYWPDATEAGDLLLRAAVQVLREAGATRIAADGVLPAPGIYGIPEQWPHIRALLRDKGFAPEGPDETVLLADLAGLEVTPAPLSGLTVARTLGAAGTRFAAHLGPEVIGYIEVDIRTGDTGLVGSHSGLADIGNLWVSPSHRRNGVGRWLVGAGRSLASSRSRGPASELCRN
ncbi:GNAT family N-acetyltransferase [Tessaracoccus sp.]|uniref:GNAT family N-acetyltransferase n=1 Tax=Tessaracoccus sp. TaxID=1971211 RepID=UPI00262C8E56|nr:GNAT family N-acetyltransferase [Tessaracoccus sp.]